MENYNNNNQYYNEVYRDMYNNDNEYDLDMANGDYDVYNSRYDNRFDRRFDRRGDRRFDRRSDRRFDNRYYQYPYCDRYGRCENPIWWLFWPFFFF